MYGQNHYKTYLMLDNAFIKYILAYIKTRNAYFQGTTSLSSDKVSVQQL